MLPLPSPSDGKAGDMRRVNTLYEGLFLLSIHFYEGLSATSFLRVHVLSRVESITEDYVESNCSMTRKFSSKKSEFLRFNL